MSTLPHTYGPTCRHNVEPDHAGDAGSSGSSELPKVQAQFFYTSFLPIDDPLSPLPPPPSDAKAAQANLTPQPFSAKDNAALEEAWQGLHQESDQKKGLPSLPRRPKFNSDRGNLPSPSAPPVSEDTEARPSVSSKEDSQDSGEVLKDFLGNKKSKPKPFRRPKQDKATAREDVDNTRKRSGQGDRSFDGPDSPSKVLDISMEELKSATKSVKQQLAKSKSQKGPLKYTKLKDALKSLDESLTASSAPEATSDSLQSLEDDMRATFEDIKQVLKKAHGRKDNDHQEYHDINTILQTINEIEKAADDCLSLLERPHDQDTSDGESNLDDSQTPPGTSLPKAGQNSPGTSGDPQKGSRAGLSKRRAADTDESHVMLCDDPDHLPEEDRPINKAELGDHSSEMHVSKRRRHSPFHHNHNRKSKHAKSSEMLSPSSLLETGREDRNTSGFPFKRAGSRRSRSPLGTDGTVETDTDERSDNSETTPAAFKNLGKKVGFQMPQMQFLRSRSKSPSRDQSNQQLPVFPWGHDKEKKKAKKASQEAQPEKSRAFVPVGVSRLHLVEMPELQMKPIYWNPINDVSSVLRGTWFYKQTMRPVEPDVANQLEIGYEYMEPWKSVWQEELDSCVEIGAEAELKVVHRLWPKEDRKSSRPSTGIQQEMDQKSLAEDSQAPVRQENRAAGSLAASPEKGKLYKNSSVIYVDAKEAQILKPSLLPSISRGRRPLKAIRKGTQIGLAVVRGFDRSVWDKLCPPSKMSITTANAKIGAFMSQSGDAATAGRRITCPACRTEEDRPKVTDLVLVIHGIGQKLSERVDSFHFTHAINSFRRQVNVELANEVVSGNLRTGLGGVMVLPINWRLTVSFDEDAESQDKTDDRTQNHYELRDITPDTLPAIRNLISDVMLDIPYYLSHHKQKMISAVIKEANRVYRLWCRNNIGFHDYGRVHLIAHSLGSAMAMDILSQQPTKLPPQPDFLKSKHVSDTMFEFDTKNIFNCGSPAGFFLLLNKANLLPRKGRDKPESDGDNMAKDVAGRAGTFGCLAVDNIYNIMHQNDPIAYRMNAAVDSDYAASLETATIPSSQKSLLQTIFRWSTPPPVFSASTGAQRPHITKLPSTMELETHDFTREEIAEKRMYLLNENGQIDYFLSSGGGPLDIQYLNMLSAHSSYWTLQDFVRFLVVEIGRRPGRDGTFVPFRAQKKRVIQAGKIV